MAWIASLGPWDGEPPRRLAFASPTLRQGQARVLPLPLEAGAEAMDLLGAPGGGWILLSSRAVAPQRWRSQITELRLQQGQVQGEWQSKPLLSFEALLPARSLAAVGSSWVVGLGPPPFQPETSPGQCSPADAGSGTIVHLISPPAPPTSR